MRTDLVIALFFITSAFTLAQPAAPAQQCAPCHPKEVQGFAKSAMARSLRPAADEPEGSFEHAFSGTHFESRNTASGVWQSLRRNGEEQKLRIQYEVGSGSHALGYVAQVGDHLFQSPISYYTNRHAWDVAPGYEEAKTPGFTRPVTMACLTCHADKPLPIADTLNRYQSPPFAAMGIQCDRCHGPVEAHLRKPVNGSIINPAKLDAAARDSVCEQCHLTGETRVPNPGKTLADFEPGKKLEDVYTVYVTARGAQLESDKQIKVISQSEELALSACARHSGGKLWCGTCHDPHDVPARPAAYFREKCLGCHMATLAPAHAAPSRDCIACHMPKRDAKDGGHTAFTDHRITRLPEAEDVPGVSTGELIAWREPDASVRTRNMALALVTAGLEKSNSGEVIRGFRMLTRLEAQFPTDPDVETALGNILLKGKQPAEAEKRFRNALDARPGYAPYEVNLAAALLDNGDIAGGSQHLERAVELDPLLQQAVDLLATLYRSQGEGTKAAELLSRYQSAMGITVEATK